MKSIADPRRQTQKQQKIHQIGESQHRAVQLNTIALYFFPDITPPGGGGAGQALEAKAVVISVVVVVMVVVVGEKPKVSGCFGVKRWVNPATTAKKITAKQM